MGTWLLCLQLWSVLGIVWSRLALGRTGKRCVLEDRRQSGKKSAPGLLSGGNSTGRELGQEQTLWNSPLEEKCEGLTNGSGAWGGTWGGNRY